MRLESGAIFGQLRSKHICKYISLLIFRTHLFLIGRSVVTAKFRVLKSDSTDVRGIRDVT